MDMMLEQFKTIFDRPEKVKRLRETILNLAVRGKLVSQDPNDEPASILLQKIKNEKERLKKEKTLVAISEGEKPFQLPNGWEWVRLGSLFNIVRGASPRPKGDPRYFTNTKTDYHWVTIKDISNSKVANRILDTIEYLTYEGSLKSRFVEKDEIIIAVSGSVGKSAIMDVDGYIYDGLAAMKFIVKNLTLRNYVYNYFKGWREKINTMAEGTSMPNINTEKLNNLVIPIPPLEEQKRIVEKVDLLMSFCDKLEKALEKRVHYGELTAKSVFNAVGNVSSAEELEETLKFILLNFKDLSLGDNAVKELKNCILQLAVQGKLVPQDLNDEPAEVLLENIREERQRLISEKRIKKEKPLSEISEEEKPWVLPSGWAFIRLANISKKIGAGSTPKGGKNVYLEQGIKFIRSQNVYNNGLFINDVAYIDEKIHDKMSGSKVEAKDILMNITGGSIGRCCIVPNNFDTGNVNQHVSIVRTIDEEMIRYIHLVLTSPYIFNTIMEMQVGISREGLSISKLSTFIIPVPPLEEQKRIVEKVDSLMLLCDMLENNVEKSKKYNTKLMEVVVANIS